MQMQHRETERRQLRETESKIFQTGFNHSRNDWQKENIWTTWQWWNNSQNTSFTHSSETLEHIWRATQFIYAFSPHVMHANAQTSQELHAEGILKVEKTGYRKLQNVGMQLQRITMFSMKRTNRDRIIDVRWWYKMWPLNGYRGLLIESRLLMM